MKRLFFIATGLIIVAAVLLVGYGIFLNYKSEKLINIRMANRILKVEGARAATRGLVARVEKPDIRMSADKLTDAKTLLDGNVEEVFVSLNEQVKKGQPICRLVNEEIPLKLAQIDVNIAKAETVSARYENSYNRYKKLLGTGAISQEQYDEVLTNYKASQEEVKQLRLERSQYELQEGRLIVTAPLDGEVLLLYKKTGSFLTAGTAVALIGDFSKLQFTENINDAELNGYEPLQATRILEVNKDDMEKIYGTGYREGNKGRDEPFYVKIRDVYPPKEVKASMRMITWEIDNKSGLLEPKHYCDAVISDLSERRVLAISKNALLDNNKDKVYVWKQPEGILELRHIETGISDERFIEVKTGLEADEVVITSGKEGLSDGLKVEVELTGGKADGKK